MAVWDTGAKESSFGVDWGAPHPLGCMINWGWAATCVCANALHLSRALDPFGCLLLQTVDTAHVLFGPFSQGTIRFVSRPEVSQPASPNTTPGGTRPPGDWLPPLKCKPTEPSTPASKCTGFGCDLCSRELRGGNAFWRGGANDDQPNPPSRPHCLHSFRCGGGTYLDSGSAPSLYAKKRTRRTFLFCDLVGFVACVNGLGQRPRVRWVAMTPLLQRVSHQNA